MSEKESEIHYFFQAFKKFCAAPAYTNTSSNDAVAGTSETTASMSAPVASTGAASPVPLPTIAVPKQLAQLPSDLNCNTPQY